MAFPLKSRKLLAIGTLAVGCSMAARANPTNLIPPFGEFALRDPTEPPKPGPPVFYAKTGAESTWQIAQWSIPGGRLSPFSTSRSDDRETLTAVAPEAAVRIVRRGMNTEVIELRQDGAVLPCKDKQGAPRESDLAFGPDKLTAKDTPLAKLRSLTLVLSASVRYGLTQHRKGCETNQSAAFGSVVLNDPSRNPPQTLFYKVSINPLCDGGGPDWQLKSCENWMRKPGFYFVHSPFGIDDWLPLLGQPFLKEGERRTLRIDLLSRLKQLIASGPAEMDRDWRHWVLNSAYAGQHIWGDAKLSSSWRRFELLAEPDWAP